MPLECNNYRKCTFGRNCTLDCPEYSPFRCSRRDRSPGACNGCSHWSRCRFDKFQYCPEDAQMDYRTTLIDSRQGVNPVSYTHLYLINIWMFEVFAEETNGRHCDQYKEIQCHQQVICNCCSRDHITGHFKCCAKCSEVYSSSDIGSGKYSCQSIQFRNKVMKCCISKERSTRCTYSCLLYTSSSPLKYINLICS